MTDYIKRDDVLRIINEYGSQDSSAKLLRIAALPSAPVSEEREEVAHVLVPVEPSREMLIAGAQEWSKRGFTGDAKRAVQRAWHKMVVAARLVRAPQQAEPKCEGWRHMDAEDRKDFDPATYCDAYEGHESAERCPPGCCATAPQQAEPVAEIVEDPYFDGVIKYATPLTNIPVGTKLYAAPPPDDDCPDVPPEDWAQQYHALFVKWREAVQLLREVEERLEDSWKADRDGESPGIPLSERVHEDRVNKYMERVRTYLARKVGAPRQHLDRIWRGEA